MPIQISEDGYENLENAECPHCGKAIYEFLTICPNCGKGLSEPEPWEMGQSKTAECPKCRAQVFDFASKCPKCGDWIDPKMAAFSNRPWPLAIRFAAIILIVALIAMLVTGILW
ncbi:MAG: zinc ribbon domain-containing protein [Planctomycetes bacterium]|nr:zinc ribbon domain-containing protein [Planctomycetota bacterium]